MGDYRLLCRFEDNEIVVLVEDNAIVVLVIAVGHRKNVYE